MPDICDLILDDHETFRRRFAEMDTAGTDTYALARLWTPLAMLLDLHAATEEEVFYPCLLKQGENAEEETIDAIGDHNKIRDALADAGRQAVGTEAWWKAVGEARTQNSDHMGEEERGALADFRSNTTQERRDELGSQFVAFKERHAGGRHLEITDRDPEAYIAEQSG
ncbi:MAG: hemerythrin domain-containing protein [Acidimicrobiales bacterium]